MKRFVSTAAAARMIPGATREAVKTWVRTRQLPGAIDVRTKPDSPPRYRVPVASIEAFVEARQVK